MGRQLTYIIYNTLVLVFKTGKNTKSYKTLFKEVQNHEYNEKR
jgi:hypothetical protein